MYLSNPFGSWGQVYEIEIISSFTSGIPGAAELHFQFDMFSLEFVNVTFCSN